MVDEKRHTTGNESDGTVEEMMSHLQEAKELDDLETRRDRRRQGGSTLQDRIQHRSDAAVLASNHEARLAELEANQTVTHRSGKAWKTAKAGVDAHGQLPIYYRIDGEVTHSGYVTEIVLHPTENSTEAEQFRRSITDDDTYSDYNDTLDTTTFIVSKGERLDDPFPQSELRKLSGNGTISHNFSRQPAYVIQRSGDFPNHP